MIPKYNIKYLDDLNNAKKLTLERINQQINVKPYNEDVVNYYKKNTSILNNISSDSLLYIINSSIRGYNDELDVLIASILPYKQIGRPRKEEQEENPEDTPPPLENIEQLEQLDEKEQVIDKLNKELEGIKQTIKDLEDYKTSAEENKEKTEKYIAELQKQGNADAAEIRKIREEAKKAEETNKSIIKTYDDLLEIEKKYRIMLTKLNEVQQNIQSQIREILNIKQDKVITEDDYETLLLVKKQSTGIGIRYKTFTPKIEGKETKSVEIAQLNNLFSGTSEYTIPKFNGLYDRTIVLHKTLLGLVNKLISISNYVLPSTIIEKMSTQSEDIRKSFQEIQPYLSGNGKKKLGGKRGKKTQEGDYYNVKAVFNNINEVLKKLLIDLNKHLIRVSKNISKAIYYDKIEIQDFNNLKNDLLTKFKVLRTLFYKRQSNDLLTQESINRYEKIFNDIEYRLDDISKNISVNVFRDQPNYQTPIMRGSGYISENPKRNYM